MSNLPETLSSMAVDVDRDAVAACQRGDANAFRPLVEKYQKRMLNLAYRMTGDYDEACEVVQEAFLSAYRSITKFRGDALFSTWLHGITLNHTKNRLRQMQSRSRHEVQSIDEPLETEEGQVAAEPASDQPTVVEQLEQKEVQARVQECIASLDQEYREVLVLRDIQGFSYDEIRAILNIPDGTVKSRLFRARDAMRLCLQKVIRSA